MSYEVPDYFNPISFLWVIELYKYFLGWLTFKQGVCAPLLLLHPGDAYGATKMHTDPPKTAYSILETCQTTSLGRSRIYQEIAAGKLAIVKVGRRTLITAEALRAWLKGLSGEAV